MLSLPPIDNASDTDFTRELKSAIRDLYAEVRRIRMTGDGATFYVTQNAGGCVGHATFEGGGAGGAMAKIASHVSGNVYLADIYAPRYEYTDGDGWIERETPDEEDATLIVTNLVFSGTIIPVDTWLAAVDCTDHYETQFTGQMVMAQIHSHVDGPVYNAYIYPDGMYYLVGSTWTIRGNTGPTKPLIIVSIASGQVVPNNTIVTAWHRGDHYEANVPRTL